MLRSTLRVSTALLPLAGIALARPQAVTLLDDINPLEFPYSGDHFNGGPVVPTANGFLFAARTEALGQELWFSDGTPAGTRQIADLAIGDSWANPYDSAVLPNGQILVAANSTLWGAEIFRVDPVTLAVDLVRDIRPGSEGAGPFGLTLWNGEAWFFADDGVHGMEVWRTDGTHAGTSLAYDFNPVGGSSNGTTRIVGSSGAMFVSTTWPEVRLHAVASPGAPSVTLVGAGPWTATGDSLDTMVALGNSLLFNYDNGVAGDEMWITDGTLGGTALFLDAAPGPGDSEPRAVASDGATLWFSAQVPGLGRELYRTDGTLAGTQFLGDANPGSGGVIGSFGQGAILGGKLYFSGATGAFGSGQLPFVTDGTLAGTQQLADLSGVVTFLEAAGTVFFTGNSPTLGRELFRTDGTPAGTGLAVEFDPGLTDSIAFLQALTPAGLLLSVDLTGGEDAPFLVDPVTLAVKPLGNGNDGIEAFGSQPGQGAEFQGRAVFNVAAAPFGGPGPVWSSDGTPQGTSPVPLDAPQFRPLVDIGPKLLYTLTTGFLQGSQVQVWSSAGIPGDAEQVLPLPPGAPDLEVREFMALGGAGFVTAEVNELGNLGLYRTDGTSTGTRLVISAAPPGNPDFTAEPTAFAGEVWFTRTDATSGAELWRTDGLPGGSARVVDLLPGPEGSEPRQLTVAGEFLYFTAETPALGVELYRADAAGNVALVRDLAPGPQSSDPIQLTPVGDALFFAADDGALGEEPYVTDGSLAGTILLGDLSAGAGASKVRFAVAAGDEVFFFARDASSAARLWATAGTPATTRIIASDNGLGGELVPFAMRPLGSGTQVVLPAWRSDLGLEPWTAGPAPGSFQLVEDLYPGPGSSTPRFWTRAGARLVFAGTDVESAEEPRSISVVGLGGYVAEPFGHACGDARIDSAGEARVGNTVDVTLSATPVSVAGLVFSRQRAYVPLAEACPLLLGGALMPLAQTSTDAAGDASVPIPIPGAPALVGTPVYLQWWTAQPGAPLVGAIALSDGLEVWIGA